MKLITLTTDFGLKDPFVGMMKGVIYNINESAEIVDITHNIDNQDILEGAFVISQSYRYFPKGTIHVVVVDPGVGSGRRPILVNASGHCFLGPDNGVLSFIIKEDPKPNILELTTEQYFLKGISSTFHGRDIFAPVAAWLSMGIEFHHFGHAISDYRKLDIPEIERGHGIIKGKVIYIDRFGNIITNITPEDIDDIVKSGIPASNIRTRIGEVEITGIRKYYAEVNKGEPATIINSFGLFEIYAYMDDAAKALNVKKGISIEICF